MMGVSCVKAMLVILVFMHLLWEANWKYVLTIPAGMMSIFLVLMLIPDIGNRLMMYSEERTASSAELVVEHHDADAHAHEGDVHADHAGRRRALETMSIGSSPAIATTVIKTAVDHSPGI